MVILYTYDIQLEPLPCIGHMILNIVLLRADCYFYISVA